MLSADQEEPDPRDCERHNNDQEEAYARDQEVPEVHRVMVFDVIGALDIRFLGVLVTKINLGVKHEMGRRDFREAYESKAQCDQNYALFVVFPISVLTEATTPQKLDNQQDDETDGGDDGVDVGVELEGTHIAKRPWEVLDEWTAVTGVEEKELPEGLIF